METQILDNEFHEPEKPIINQRNIRYAGFWTRLKASFIDFFALLPIVALNYYNLLSLKNLFLEIIILLLSFLYKPLMEFYYSATLGKMAVNIKVVNYDYDKISLEQAFIRYIPWILSNIFSIITTITLFNTPAFYEADEFMELGYAMNQSSTNIYNQLPTVIFVISALVIAFNDKKQALHDILARTYCIYKD